VGFVYELIGRPSTALQLMNVIRDRLVSAGWTLLAEGTAADGSNYKFLRTSSYPMPDNTEAGAAVLELRNPAGTNHLDLKMWNGWDATQNQPLPPSCPDEFNHSYLRTAYGVVTTINYWLYANEFWFALAEHNPSTGAPRSDSWHKTLAGVALPPTGVPTAPPFKALFVASPYLPTGTWIPNSNNEGTRHLISRFDFWAYIALNPMTGRNFWSQWKHFTEERITPIRYEGHPDLPPYLFPLFLNAVGLVPYARITGNTSFPLGTQRVIGAQTWVNIFDGWNGGEGQLWVRIA
jgi:hypothetical protein